MGVQGRNIKGAKAQIVRLNDFISVECRSVKKIQSPNPLSYCTVFVHCNICFHF